MMPLHWKVGSLQSLHNTTRLPALDQMIRSRDHRGQRSRVLASIPASPHRSRAPSAGSTVVSRSRLAKSSALRALKVHRVHLERTQR